MTDPWARPANQPAAPSRPPTPRPPGPVPPLTGSRLPQGSARTAPGHHPAAARRARRRCASPRQRRSSSNAVPRPTVDRADPRHRARAGGRRVARRRAIARSRADSVVGQGVSVRGAGQRQRVVRRDAAVPAAALHRHYTQHLGRRPRATRSVSAKGMKAQISTSRTSGSTTPATPRAPSAR